MRNAILLLDFCDESSSAFKELLLHATFSSMYLKTEEVHVIRIVMRS